jgi:hypothetical protein
MTGILFYILWLSVIATSCLFIIRYCTEFKKSFILFSLLLKLTAGIVFASVYTYYYQEGDTLSYFKQGEDLARVAKNDFSQFRSIILYNSLPSERYSFNYLIESNKSNKNAFFFVKIVSIFYLSGIDNFWALSLLFTYFSFAGSMLLANYLVKLNPDSRLAIIISLLFYPSIVFWSAGLSRESLLMSGCCVLIFVALEIRNSQKLWLLIPALVLCWFIFNLKYYFIAALLPLSILFLPTRFLNFKNFAFLAGGCFILLVLAGFFHPNLSIQNIIKTVTDNHTRTTFYEDTNLIEYTNMDSGKGFIRNIPLALFSGLYRPLAWEYGSFTARLAGIENLLLLALSVISLTSFRKIRKRDLNSPSNVSRTIIFCFIIAAAIFLAVASPQLGSLMRYKILFLPFFTWLIFSSNNISDFLERHLPTHLVFSRK